MARRIRVWLLNEIVAIGLWLAMIGSAMNYFAIISNGGMPVCGAMYRNGFHIPMNENTNLPWLADWVHVQFLDINRVVSPGDLFIWPGMGVSVFGIIWGYSKFNWGSYHAHDGRRIA